MEAIQQSVHTQVQQYEWFPLIDSVWFMPLVQEISSRIATRFDLIDKDSTLPDRQKIQEAMLEQVFFGPLAIRQIYAMQPEPDMQAFVQEGIHYHCRFLERATASVVRKFSGSYRRLDINQDDLVEELWGVVMEDIVRALTDTSARLWFHDHEKPLSLPLENQRSTRRGIVIRTALSPSGRQAALFHSDANLTLWDTPTQSIHRIWDLRLLGQENQDREHQNEKQEIDDIVSPVALYFSSDSQKLALEWKKGVIMVLPLEAERMDFTFHSSSDMNAFIKDFGAPFVPDRAANIEVFSFSQQAAERISNNYLAKVYDWTIDSKSKVLLTGSEMERGMPHWMQQLGFQRAVFVIIKRRLIDLVRKSSRTGYHCWRCGMANHSSGEIACSHCGVDFKRCPLGCPIPPSEILGKENQWTCPHCGCASRVPQTMVEVPVEELHSDPSAEFQSWRDEHDLARIKAALSCICVTYRKRQIPCNEILDLKVQGLTNEEIGAELGIPRGSVDYIWNQCRNEILQQFRNTEVFQ